MTDSTEDFVLKQFRESVERLIESVREMIAASKLLRARIESNDDMLRIAQQEQRRIDNRLDVIEKSVVQLENTAILIMPKELREQTWEFLIRQAQKKK